LKARNNKGCAPRGSPEIRDEGRLGRAARCWVRNPPGGERSPAAGRTPRTAQRRLWAEARSRPLLSQAHRLSAPRNASRSGVAGRDHRRPTRRSPPSRNPTDERLTRRRELEPATTRRDDMGARESDGGWTASRPRRRASRRGAVKDVEPIDGNEASGAGAGAALGPRLSTEETHSGGGRGRGRGKEAIHDLGPPTPRTDPKARLLRAPGTLR